MPAQILQHPGVDWRQFINNMYFPFEGIYGITLWVYPPSCFTSYYSAWSPSAWDWVSFCRQCNDGGRSLYRGPAKVSVVSSHFLAPYRDHRSPIRYRPLTDHTQHETHGLSRHFAGGVEQPRVPEGKSRRLSWVPQAPHGRVSRSTLHHYCYCSIVPATMHYIGVLSIVHFTAKKLNLPTYPKDQLPNFSKYGVKAGSPSFQ